MVYRRKTIFALLAVALLGSVAWIQHTQVAVPLKYNPHYPRIQVSDGDGVIWEAVLNVHAVSAYLFAPSDAAPGDDIWSRLGTVFPSFADHLVTFERGQDLLYFLRHETVLMEEVSNDVWSPVLPGAPDTASVTIRVPIVQQLYVVEGHNPTEIDGCIKLSDCRLICDPPE
jgi:hypothetical protein